MWQFFYFHCDFWSSWSTAYLLTVASDKIDGICNRCGTTEAAALDILKAFNRVWHPDLIEFQVIYLPAFSVCFVSVTNVFLWLWMGSFNAGCLKASILGPALFLLYINDFPDDAVCNIDIYADDTTIFSK